MELEKKLYIVNFSDSEKYQLVTDSVDHNKELARIEDELRRYLQHEFPDDDSFTYFVTPRVTEISWVHRDQFSGYPVLDDKAIESIKQELKREIQARDDDNVLDSNAPFNTVGPLESIH